MSTGKMSITPAVLPSGDVCIYEYGVRVDHECLRAIENQIAKARRLYNALVAAIRDIVESMNTDVILRAGPEAEALQARIEHLTDEFAAARSADDESRMKRIAEERQPLWRALSDVLKDTRRAHKAAIQEQYLNRIGKRATCVTYQLRCAAVADGLGWATANATLDAALNAFKKTFTRGRTPRFCKGDDKVQDTLTLQFTAAGGVPAAAILADAHSELGLQTTGCGRRQYGSFRFRLGSGCTASVATGTWQYHRPIPAGASVGLARLVRRRVGKDNRWVLQLMVKRTLVVADNQDRQPLAAVHFGWSHDVTGRRVAGIAVGADPGLARVLQLPPEIEEALDRSAEIQSERNHARDEIVAAIKSSAWADALLAPLNLAPSNHTHTGPHGPASVEQQVAWAAERLQSILRLPAQHVALRRLHTLCYALRAIDALPAWLETWRKRDRVRWQSAAHVARRARMRRRDFYRVTAAGLAQSFQALALEPLDLAAAATVVEEATGVKTDLARTARAGRVVAALYEFESALRWAAAKHGTALFDVTGVTVQTCAHCGGAVSPDTTDGQLLRCSGCGAEIDRKLNGAAVAWQAVRADLENLVTEFWRRSLAAKQTAADKQQEMKSRMAGARKRVAITLGEVAE